MSKISDILIESNKWWKTSFSIEYKEREIYTQLSNYLHLPQIIAFTGLRRVGKTTLMFKIIHDYLDRGFNPNHILYFSFDEFRETSIREIIKEYENIHKINIEKGQYLILLDEIQKLNNWEEKLKRIYDMYGKTIKIIISGSLSLFIKKKSKETLAGRIFEFKITPLTFKEFLIFKEKKFKNINLYEKELEKLFEDFKEIQGFPELVNIKEKEIIKKYIQESIVEKVIYLDITNLYNILDVSILESLLTIIMEQPGQIIELSEFANDLHISRQTLSTYIKYLEDSFLIRKLYNYSGSKRKTERKLKKYYPTILSPNLIFKEGQLSQSKVFEGIVINQLQAEFFWKDPYKHEVDIILDRENIKPIEVKYGKIETKGLRKFMDKFHIKNGYILSKNTEQKLNFNDKEIIVVPAYKYLLK